MRVRLQRLNPLSHVASVRRNRRNHRNIKMLAEEFGMVYFGHVSTRDDIRIIRGLTASHTHDDRHYAIGTYEAYDIMFVERRDSTLSIDMRRTSNAWFIIEIDLKAARDLPHIFIGPHSKSDSFYQQLFIKHPHLRTIQLTEPSDGSNTFSQRYVVHGDLARQAEIEQILCHSVTSAIANHFGILALEIHHQSVYVYASHPDASDRLLEGMLKNGIWLAKYLDAAHIK